MAKNRVEKDKHEQLLEQLYAQSNGYVIEEDERRLILDKGGEPTYGEITFAGAQTLLKDLRLTYKDIFYDLGSGIGKLAAQVYLTTPTKKIVGIELASTRHTYALRVYEQLQQLGKIQPQKKLLYLNGDIVYLPIDDATIVYICSTCFSEELMHKITERLSQLQPGLRVVTLKKLAAHAKFRLIKEYMLPMSWYTEVVVYLYLLEK